MVEHKLKPLMEKALELSLKLHGVSAHESGIHKDMARVSRRVYSALGELVSENVSDQDKFYSIKWMVREFQDMRGMLYIAIKLKLLNKKDYEVFLEDYSKIDSMVQAFKSKLKV